MQTTVGQRGGMTGIVDSPAIDGLIISEGTTRQGTAAPEVEDTAPVVSSRVTLQSTVGQGARVVTGIVDRPAIVGLISGQRTTHQGAAAPKVIETAPGTTSSIIIISSGVAKQHTVGQGGGVTSIVDSPAISGPIAD